MYGIGRLRRPVLAANLLATFSLLKYPDFVEHFEVDVDAVLLLLLELLQLLKREHVLHVLVDTRLRDLQFLTVRIQERLQQAEVVHVFLDGSVTSEGHEIILLPEVRDDLVDERVGAIAKVTSRGVLLLGSLG